MTTLDLNSPHNEINLTKPVIRLTVGLKAVKLVAGAIGLLVTYPLFFVFRGIILLRTRSIYKHTVSLKKQLDKDFSSYSEKEIVNTHLKFEVMKLKAIPDLDQVLIGIKSTFPESLLLKFMTSYLVATKEIIIKEEETLRKAAYPSIMDPIDDDHRKELLEKFEKLGHTDWDDDSYDDYDRIYLNK